MGAHNRHALAAGDVRYCAAQLFFVWSARRLLQPCAATSAVVSPVCLTMWDWLTFGQAVLVLAGLDSLVSRLHYYLRLDVTAESTLLAWSLPCQGVAPQQSCSSAAIVAVAQLRLEMLSEAGKSG